MTSLTTSEPLDLDAIDVEWLRQCGPCDLGIPAMCTHPAGDYRPVMLALVNELRRLRRTDSPRAWLLPSEPGPEVTALRDKDGRRWERGGKHGVPAHVWVTLHPVTKRVQLARSWKELLTGFSPLVDASGDTDD